MSLFLFDDAKVDIFFNSAIVEPSFFEEKIAEFAIILELNGYSDCLKIR